MEIDEVIKRIYALYDAEHQLTVDRHLAEAAPVAHGWYTLVRNYGRAALLLDGAGLSLEGAPLRRAMIEHGVALTWLATEPDEALKAFSHAAQFTASKIRNVMDDGWGVPTEVFEKIAASDFEQSPRSKNVHFTPLAEELGHRDLRVVWLHQTLYCHPSLTGAQAYLSLDPSGEKHKLLPSHDYVGDVRMEVAVLLLIASDGFNRFLPGAPWRNDLEELAHAIKKLAITHKETSEPPDEADSGTS